MSTKDIIKQMTLEEKAMLCSGKDFWHTKPIDRLGIPSIMVSDGPHGLRKMGDSEDLDLSQSKEATCFPPACATACSWDRALLYEIGEAIAEEALQEGISVVLGPAMNIKRSPLCGRNFEYISEDPYLTGELAAAIINGIQSKGIGTSAKHFCANNQETLRFVVSSVVNERALREIYLAGFERAIKQAHPQTVMHSYNRLNGCYTGEDRRLLTAILRDEWGFDGIVMSDWGAIDDRVQALIAGCELEMPGSGGINDRKIVEAVQAGRLSEEILDTAVERLLSLIFRSGENRKEAYTYDVERHHQLARKAAAESYILLKNESDILPIKQGTKLAVIGEFAMTPRYQGGGSSHINPIRIDSAWESFTSAGFNCTYQQGYDLASDKPDAGLIEKAVEAARQADIAIVFAGLTDEYESEGFDRQHMRMPGSHNQLIGRVAAANPNTVVVLSAGSPVEMPWIHKAKAVLHTCLGGQAAGSAAVDVLTGKVNPSGKLSETYPLKYEDTPCYNYFPGGQKTVEYRESIFVGYRYYDTAQRDVLFPFGHGLSYTHFDYSDISISPDSLDGNSELTISLKVKNTGSAAGAEIVQLYVQGPAATVFRPKKELKGFEKIYLLPGEEKTVKFTLDKRSFAWYEPNHSEWVMTNGEYEILAGSSSRDIRLHTTTIITSGREPAAPSLEREVPIYYNLPKDGSWLIPKEQFEAVYGKELPPSSRSKDEPYTQNSTVNETRSTMTGKLLARFVKAQVGKASREANESSKRMMMASIMDMPLRAMVVMSGGTFTLGLCEGLLLIMNGHLLKGIKRFMKKG